MVVFPPPPEDPKPPTGRTRHPFFMHEMIRRQVVAVRATLGVLPVDASAIPAPPPGGRVLFVGIGTSYHAALGVNGMARARAAGRFTSEAVTAFDLLDDPDQLGGASAAIVFSASGETAVTNAALERMRVLKIPTTLVTTAKSSTAAGLADHRLVTRYSEEASWTNTVSYTCALAAGLTLLEAWTPSATPPAATAGAIEEALTHALAFETRAVELVERLAPAKNILIVGSGHAHATAREAALKFREASGRFAATGGVEELLHGMIPSVTSDSAVLAVTGTPFECRRAQEGLKAAAQLGATTLHIDSSGTSEGDDAWPLLPLPAPVAPIPQVAPLQLLAYWLAVSEGRNPDVMGLDDPRYLQARRSFGI